MSGRVLRIVLIDGGLGLFDGEECIARSLDGSPLHLEALRLSKLGFEAPHYAKEIRHEYASDASDRIFPKAS